MLQNHNNIHIVFFSTFCYEEGNAVFPKKQSALQTKLFQETLLDEEEEEFIRSEDPGKI